MKYQNLYLLYTHAGKLASHPLTSRLKMDASQMQTSVAGHTLRVGTGCVGLSRAQNPHTRYGGVRLYG